MCVVTEHAARVGIVVRMLNCAQLPPPPTSIVETKLGEPQQATNTEKAVLVCTGSFELHEFEVDKNTRFRDLVAMAARR